jgi:hypothetical protein
LRSGATVAILLGRFFPENSIQSGFFAGLSELALLTPFVTAWWARRFGMLSPRYQAMMAAGQITGVE